jgi:hypothetical protein
MAARFIGMEAKRITKIFVQEKRCSSKLIVVPALAGAARGWSAYGEGHNGGGD